MSSLKETDEVMIVRSRDFDKKFLEGLTKFGRPIIVNKKCYHQTLRKIPSFHLISRKFWGETQENVLFGKIYTPEN